MRCFIVFAVSLLSLALSPSAFAQLTISSPGAQGVTVSDLPDFATDVLHNPWDMDSINDLSNFLIHIDHGKGLGDFRNWSFNNGIFGFPINTSDEAYFYMLSPGVGPSTIITTIGKSGLNVPIDSAKYHNLSLRMYTDTPSQFRVTWHTETSYSANFVVSNPVSTQAGWRVYTVDLNQLGISQSARESRGWSEAQVVRGFRIEPGSSGNVRIDWIRLSADTPAPVPVNYTFTPQGAHTRFSLFVDDDTDETNGWLFPLIQGSASNAAVSIPTGLLPPGRYYVTGRTDGGAHASSPGVLAINSPPTLQILRPNPRGGRDFAATELGNPWNMDDAFDFYDIRNTDTASILPNNFVNGVQGDFFFGVSHLGDPDTYQTAYRAVRESQPLINPRIYRNWTVTAFIGREQNIITGGVSRMIWERDKKPWNGDDIVVPGSESGWYTVTQDMTKAEVRGFFIHPNPPTDAWDGSKGESLVLTDKLKRKKKHKKKRNPKGGKKRGKNMVNMLRFDIHEYSDSPPNSSAGTPFWIDRMELRADHEANTRFALTYDLEDRDTNASQVLLSAYYNTAESTQGGAPIFENMAAGSTTRVYLWDTSVVPAGTYWVYLQANDGKNITTRLGHRIVIDHSQRQDTTAPALLVRAPQPGANFGEELLVSGYAIDEQQIAVIEVLIDGVLRTLIEPNLFDAEARSAFPRYADASNAGFRELVDTRNLSLGAHQLELKAYDVAGNMVSQSIPFIRVAGTVAIGSPAPVDSAPIDLPLTGEVPVELKLSGNARRGKLVASVENGNLCVTGELVAHSNSKALQDNPQSGKSLAVLSKAKRIEKVSLKNAGSAKFIAVRCSAPDGRVDIFAVTRAPRGRR